MISAGGVTICGFGRRRPARRAPTRQGAADWTPGVRGQGMHGRAARLLMRKPPELAWVVAHQQESSGLILRVVSTHQRRGASRGRSRPPAGGAVLGGGGSSFGTCVIHNKC